MPLNALFDIVQNNTNMKNNTNKKDISQLQITYLFSQLLEMSKSLLPFGYNPKDENEPVKLKDPTGKGFTPNCPFHIPKFYNENPNIKERTRGKNHDPEKIYEYLADRLRTGKTDNWAILLAIKAFLKRQLVLFKKENNVITAFEGNAKGSKRYAQKQMARVHEHATIATKLKPYTMFLTLTQRVEVGKQDIISQWKSFNAYLETFLDNLQKKYNVEYERVAEATNNGYRHEHIVLHFTKKPCKLITRKHKNSEEVVGGEIRAFIKRNWHLGTSKLEISKKRSPINYLLKYIGKCAYTDLGAILKQEKELSKEQRKQLLTIFCSIIAKCRQCNLSQLPKNEQTSSAECAMSAQTIALEEGGLDTPSINSDLPCASIIRFMNYKVFQKASEGELKDFDALTQAKKEDLYQKGGCFGCTGCIMTHLLNEIKTHNDPWFHQDVQIKKINQIISKQKTEKAIEEETTLPDWVTNIEDVALDNVMARYELKQKIITNAPTNNIYLNSKEVKREEYYSKYDYRVVPFMMYHVELDPFKFSLMGYPELHDTTFQEAKDFMKKRMEEIKNGSFIND